MKLTLSITNLLICVATIGSISIPQLAQAQVPTIIDTAPEASKEQPAASTTTATVSKLEVRCQDLKTVVQKGDQQAVMMTWNTNHFGKEFSNLKRCQVVSERLQKAATLNGGTFKGLELASGTINFQPVICALQNGSKKCTADNMLFTLKPENADDPEAVIEQIFNFAEEGSGMVNESTRSTKRVDRNLGNWERKNFARKKSVTTTPRNPKKGF
jgi:iron uptake system EfeUOB component EfeO/EfeM